MMNDDTISRRAAINALVKQTHLTWEHLKTMYPMLNVFEKLPSAERRGRWEHLGGDEWFCTACGHVITTEGSWERPWQKYCEECGAKMTREDEEMSKVSEMEMTYGEYLNG